MGVNVTIVDPLRLPTAFLIGNHLARPGVNYLKRYPVGCRPHHYRADLEQEPSFARKAESE
jgi:hypothetical protein